MWCVAFTTGRIDVMVPPYHVRNISRLSLWFFSKALRPKPGMESLGSRLPRPRGWRKSRLVSIVCTCVNDFWGASYTIVNEPINFLCYTAFRESTDFYCLQDAYQTVEMTMRKWWKHSTFHLQELSTCLSISAKRWYELTQPYPLKFTNPFEQDNANCYYWSHVCSYFKITQSSSMWAHTAAFLQVN